MKKYLFFILSLLTISLSSTYPQDQKKTVLTPILPFPAFQDGEELKYTLHYGFIKGGEGAITLKKETLNGQDVFHAVAKAKTTGLANSLFRVSDTYESYFDIKTNMPLKAVRNIREGNYKYYDEVFYNRSNNSVTVKKKDNEKVVKVPANILDMVSAFFYLRRIDFSKYKGGEIVSLDTYFGDEIFPFYVIFKGRENIDIGAGTFKCLKFVPIVEPGRIFKENDDMTFWFSDDDNKIPIRIKFDMIVGSFKCDLSSAKNLKYNFLAKLPD